MRILSDNEVFALENFLVEANETTVAIEVANGTRGIGGSNTSGFCAHREVTKSLDELKDGKPWVISALEICAVVNDVVYLRNPELRIVCTIKQEEDSLQLIGESIAYDTYTAIRVAKIKR